MDNFSEKVTFVLSIILRKSQFENACPQTIDFIGFVDTFSHFLNQDFLESLIFCKFTFAIFPQSLQYLHL